MRQWQAGQAPPPGFEVVPYYGQHPDRVKAEAAPTAPKVCFLDSLAGFKLTLGNLCSLSA